MKRCAGVSYWARNPKTSLQTRAAGPVILCALVMVLGVGIGHGQPVPDTILLPDSLGPLRPGYHLAFGSSTNNIYVASESSDIIVVDGNTFQRIKRINTGTPVGGALLVSQHNKLYCSYPSEGRIGVIDCATNSIVGSIQVGTRPTLLSYSSGSDKLYCGDTIDQTVSVIDCAADTVCKVISVGRGLTAMAYDPTTSKMYAATRDAVRAISCSADSVVANIDTVKSSKGLLVNRRRQKLYAVSGKSLYVIGTPTDSLVAQMGSYSDPSPELACNEAADRLYAVTGDYSRSLVEEYDCLGDTMVRSAFVASCAVATGLVCDSVRSRLYYLYQQDSYGYIVVLDSSLNTIARTRVENDPLCLELDPMRRRVICAGGRWEAVLAVFGCDNDSLSEVGVVPLRGWDPIFGPTQLCHSPSVGKLYYRWGDAAGGVGVIDEQTNQVTRQVILPTGSGVGYLAYSRTSNRLYCGARLGVVVLDGETDSVLKLVEIGHGVNGLCWYPEGNKLYCYDIDSPSWYIAVLDCYTDSVIKEIPGPNVAGRLDYLGNGRLLCRQGDRLRLIDCVTDSVLVDTVTGGGVAYLETHTGDGAKIYIAHGHGVDVLDANSLAVRTTIEWEYMSTRGDWPSFVYSDSTDKLYWFASDNWGAEPDSALVIDTRGDTVVARLGAGFQQRPGCLDHTGRYIFCPDTPYDMSLIVYDSQGDSVAAVYSGLPVPVCVVPNPERGRIYVGCGDVILVYPDAPPGVEETPNAEGRTTNRGPTLVSGVLVLGAVGGRQNTEYRAGLMDISGRKVLDLHTGANDIRALAPGVYFLRRPKTEDGRPDAAVRKIVIAR